MNRVTVDYSGLNKLKKTLTPLSHAEVQVGFFDKKYPGVPTEAFPEGYNEGRYVAEVAYLNNIHTNEAPARPFMEETLDDKHTKANVRLALYEILSGKLVSKTLEKLGEKEVILMKKIIEEYDQFDHNSESWIEAKGFDDVLQYTDFMLESVEHRVEYRNK